MVIAFFVFRANCLFISLGAFALNKHMVVEALSANIDWLMKRFLRDWALKAHLLQPNHSSAPCNTYDYAQPSCGFAVSPGSTPYC
ncbi:uncharacterized protein BKA55DRAFT_583402 [Fusarium redolens]|uniref:Secreted protein n=1 Tax=Fusarium redolens TaxID=48865 RepID=A0A9P9G171_FUSRE|nr:uncharacterized protein BKA55DRAFT_583402 [Fusarium redolens]KAH7230087.1 hypothetical protein BKA55DRAFT_583402 [Fusarium redolens]